MNILIVDDDRPAVSGIIQIFDWKRMGISKVFSAYGVNEAISKLQDESVDILLTDIEMLDGTGFDLIKWCNERGHNYVSVILSSFPNFYYAQHAMALGVYEYLLKPIDDDVLESTIIRSMVHLKKRHAVLEPPKTGNDLLVERVRFYIIEHISEEISRNDLASFVGLSPEYLSTYFKKETGTTLSEHIKAERVEFAKRLLRHSNLSISAISGNVGYDSLSYFSQVFRRSVGFTPREYRQQKLKER